MHGAAEDVLQPVLLSRLGQHRRIVEEELIGLKLPGSSVHVAALVGSEAVDRRRGSPGPSRIPANDVLVAVRAPAEDDISRYQ